MGWLDRRTDRQWASDQDPPGRLPSEVFRVRPTGKRPRGQTQNTLERLYIWSGLGTPRGPPRRAGKHTPDNIPNLYLSSVITKYCINIIGYSIKNVLMTFACCLLYYFIVSEINQQIWKWLISDDSFRPVSRLCSRREVSFLCQYSTHWGIYSFSGLHLPSVMNGYPQFPFNRMLVLYGSANPLLLSVSMFSNLTRD